MSGFCFEQRRYLADREKIEIAIDHAAGRAVRGDIELRSPASVIRFFGTPAGGCDGLRNVYRLDSVLRNEGKVTTHAQGCHGSHAAPVKDLAVTRNVSLHCRYILRIRG
jgi:hypothetical protein